jgi:hypothetical protein
VETDTPDKSYAIAKLILAMARLIGQRGRKRKVYERVGAVLAVLTIAKMLTREISVSTPERAPKTEFGKMVAERAEAVAREICAAEVVRISRKGSRPPNVQAEGAAFIQGRLVTPSFIVQIKNSAGWVIERSVPRLAGADLDAEMTPDEIVGVAAAAMVCKFEMDPWEFLAIEAIADNHMGPSIGVAEALRRRIALERELAARS